MGAEGVGVSSRKIGDHCREIHHGIVGRCLNVAVEKVDSEGMGTLPGRDRVAIGVGLALLLALLVAGVVTLGTRSPFVGGGVVVGEVASGEDASSAPIEHPRSNEDRARAASREGDNFRLRALRQEPSLSIRVIDPAGTPVPGVALRFSFDYAPTLGERLKRMVDFGLTRNKERNRKWTRLGLTEDPSGIFVWEDLVSRVSDAETATKTVTGVRFRTEIPGAADNQLVLSSIPESRVVDLEVAAIGDLTIKIIDPTGKLAVGDGEVQIRELTFDADGVKWKNGRSVRQAYRAGVARIPGVVLDRDFEVKFRHDNYERVLRHVAGPRRGESDATREFVLDDSLPYLRGRLLNPAGEPLANHRLGVQSQVGYHWANASGQTDSEGRFLLLIPRHVLDRKLQILYLLASDSLPRAVDMSSLPALSPGVMELGDVFVPEPVVLVSGTIINPRKASYSKRSLGLEYRAKESDVWSFIKMRPEIMGDRFQVSGPSMPGSYRLTVNPRTGEALQPCSIEFTPGTKDLQITIEHGHFLMMSVSLPNDPKNFARAFGSFDVWLRPTAGAAMREQIDLKDRRSRLRAQSKKQTELQWMGLTAGTYQLEVRIHDEPTPFKIIPGIQVPGDRSNAANIELDLRETLRAVNLELIGPEGSIPDRGVRVHLLHQRRLLRFVDMISEDTELLVLPGAMDAWILAPGHEPVVLPKLSDDMQVKLEPSKVAVAVSLAEPVDLPPGMSLLLKLESDGESAHEGSIPEVVGDEPRSRNLPFSPFYYLNLKWPARSQIMMDPSSARPVDVHRLGRQVIRLELLATSEAMRARMQQVTIPVEGFAPTSFEVKAGMPNQRLELQVPQAAVDEALRKAGLR